MVAVAGSDFVEPGSPFALPVLDWPAGMPRNDVSYPHSYEATTVPALEHALAAIAAESDRFDVISNHCLHPLPIRRASMLGVPMLTTLHTPPDDDVIAAHAAAGPNGSRFVSVSDFTRREWARAGLRSELLANGVDPSAWPEGTGGEHLVWFGRIVPEKAPHLAVEVARRLGRPLTIAGRIGDHDYAAKMLFPLLDAEISYVGPLAPSPLAELVGGSAAALSTPAWAEPFGLVAPEALMCGTPVVSFAVGGVPEVAVRTVGMELVAAGDIAAMTARVDHLINRSVEDASFRRRVRASAVRRFSLDARIETLESRFAQIVASDRFADEMTA